MSRTPSGRSRRRSCTILVLLRGLPASPSSLGDAAAVPSRSGGRAAVGRHGPARRRRRGRPAAGRRLPHFDSEMARGSHRPTGGPSLAGGRSAVAAGVGPRRRCRRHDGPHRIVLRRPLHLLLLLLVVVANGSKRSEPPPSRRRGRNRNRSSRSRTSTGRGKNDKAAAAGTRRRVRPASRRRRCSAIIGRRRR